ncbi:MAG: hypothetical protein WCQ95_10630 [Bacteroidota bacterium]
MGSNPILSAIFFKIIRYFQAFYVFLMGKKLNLGFTVIFSLFMIPVYLGMGLYCIFYVDFNAKFGIPIEYSGVGIFFGVFLIVYGIFRFVRIFPKLKNRRDYEKD